MAAQQEGTSELSSVTLKVEAMCCNACAGPVEALVRSEAGVRTSDVFYQARQARVLSDPQAASEDRLNVAIERGGHDNPAEVRGAVEVHFPPYRDSDGAAGLAHDLSAPLRRIEGGKYFTPEDHPDVIAEEINALIAAIAASRARST